MSDRPWRLFVAVPIPPDPLAQVIEVLEPVRTGPLGRVPRWVHLDNLHLTVRFLGETPGDLAPDVALAVRDALSGHEAFDIVLAGAGAFPPRGKPRALWLGIQAGAEGLGALADALDGPLEPLGWPADPRPYRPHLTVARMDSASISSGLAVTQALAEAVEGHRIAFRADRVALYRSHLGGPAPRYEPLVEVLLPG